LKLSKKLVASVFKLLKEHLAREASHFEVNIRISNPELLKKYGRKLCIVMLTGVN
jgi:hypothetical protein